MHPRLPSVAFAALLTSTATAMAAPPWQGTWGRDAESCAKGLVEGGASFRLSPERVDAPGYACDLKVEAGHDGDLLVEDCRGGGRFLPAFDLVAVRDGRLYVTTPGSAVQRSFVRCE